MHWGGRVALVWVVALGALVAACSDDGGSSDDEEAAPEEQEADDGGGSAGCSRDDLEAVAGDYFAALAAHDPDELQLSSDLKSTENGAEIEPGQGLWQTAGEARFTRTIVDTETCGTHSQAVLQDGGVDVLYGVRLKLDAGDIAEMESYISRQGDYFLFSPDGLVESETTPLVDVRWADPVPEDQRSTRDELVDIADRYYQSFGLAGYVAPMRNGCFRWENGVRTTAGDCTVGLPPEGSMAGDGAITNRRYPLADVERGVVVAYVRFAGALDFHMFKVVGGEIRLITAVVTAQGHESTGWEDQEAPEGTQGPEQPAGEQ